MRCLGLEVSMAQQESGFARDGYLHQSHRGQEFAEIIFWNDEPLEAAP